MEKTELVEQVLSVIADYKGIAASDVKVENTWAELNLDSLDVTELAMRLEDALNVEINVSPEIVNVQALIDYIAEQL